MSKVFWYLNKQTNEARVFTTIAAIDKKTDLKKDMLYYHFSREKKTELETETHRIVKLETENKNSK